MKIFNPATGAELADLTADNAKAVAAKYKRARAAQPAWARRSMRYRLAIMTKFRAMLVARIEELARTLTQEVGKPIRQARNEVNGLVSRIDFFLAATSSTLRDKKVFADAAGKLEERIAHEPLGVIANVSAWNYPYFVGGNVFVPALLAGNTVLYKPSEYS
ncbi:MAG: aldehyde dehydrogenase family protein, partial [Betaproteobacteria bacterium]